MTVPTPTPGAPVSAPKTSDSFVASLYTGVDTANVLGTIAVTSGAIAYTTLRRLALALDEAREIR